MTSDYDNAGTTPTIMTATSTFLSKSTTKTKKKKKKNRPLWIVGGFGVALLVSWWAFATLYCARLLSDTTTMRTSPSWRLWWRQKQQSSPSFASFSSSSSFVSVEESLRRFRRFYHLDNDSGSHPEEDDKKTSKKTGWTSGRERRGRRRRPRKRRRKRKRQRRKPRPRQGEENARPRPWHPDDVVALESYLASLSSSAAAVNSPHHQQQPRQNPLIRPLRAYIERPLNATVPNSWTYGSSKNKDEEDVGTPPRQYVPLPLRTASSGASPEELHVFEYYDGGSGSGGKGGSGRGGEGRGRSRNRRTNRIRSCHDIPGGLPVGRTFQDDADADSFAGGGIGKGRGRPNVHNKHPLLYDEALASNEALYSPTSADPFLPWIHDIFPSADGSTVHIVAQNKRRCNTGYKFLEELRLLEGQVALMQGVSVKRLTDDEARALAPELWHPSSDFANTEQEDEKEEEEEEFYEDEEREEDGGNDEEKDDDDDDHDQDHDHDASIDTYPPASPTRYRLVPYDLADDDGKLTRFICRFHRTILDSGVDGTDHPTRPVNVFVGETLSTYPMNYELVNYRKALPTCHSMLTPRGKDNFQFWLSNQRFDCPLPTESDVPGLRRAVSSGNTVMSDGTPTLYLDLIPIRTPARFGVSELYFNEDIAGPRQHWGKEFLRNDKHGWIDLQGNRNRELGGGRGGGDGSVTIGFNATLRWGERNVMPRVEASGRWENLPICWPSRVTGGLDAAGKEGRWSGGNATKEEGNERKMKEEEREARFDNNEDQSATAAAMTIGDDGGSTEYGLTRNNETTTKAENKPHVLSACVWASATYTTRGDADQVTDAEARLMEWIEFHLLVGFDHIYVYDNTGAHTNATSLERVLSSFDETEVTRIDWPHRVCNNNIPAHENTGERSSQYAAESSCRERFGPYSEWMASFDPDEYIVPMGKFRDLKDVVRSAGRGGTNILSFKSTRAVPVASLMEEAGDTGRKGYDDGCGGIANADGASEEDEGGKEKRCLKKRSDVTFLETYNCELERPGPKPKWAMRAKKQMYRPDYVLSHYVHYSTITKGLVETYREREEKRRRYQEGRREGGGAEERRRRRGRKEKRGENDGGDGGPPGEWSHSYRETSPSERFAHELHEAVMIHTKTTVPAYTIDWRIRCRYGFEERWMVKCRVGYPWPDNIDRTGEGEDAESDPDGMKYNCFQNARVRDEWLGKLKEAMERRRRRVEEIGGGGGG